MMQPRAKNPKQKHAVVRITTLFAQAAIRPAFARRYVALARTISSRTKTPIPRALKAQMCKGCDAYLTGANSTTRIRNHRKIITCNDCMTIKRIAWNKP